MDIQTLVLALALGNLSLCAALFFFEYERKKALSISTWAVAKQCQAVAWCLLYFRGVLPDFLAILLANSLLFAGMALDAGALWQAAGRSGWRRSVLPVLGLAVALFAAACLSDVAPVLRSAGASLIVAGFFLAGVAALCLKWREASMLRRFLVVSMGLLSLLVAARGLLSVLAPGLDGEWVQLAGFGALYLSTLYLMMLTNAFGYLLLSREKLGQELARLEVLDVATGVPNRRGFYQALAPWMALARRPGLPTALVVFKIDHFKRVNDSYGHPVGDAVLKTVADICRQQLRDSDLMGRLGGAEFAVQLPRTNLADALVVAERIRAAVAALPVKTERAVLSLTASLGVTTVRAEDSTVSLFKRADEALQAAKLAGRNRVMEAQPAGALDM
ncbi:GGDEF domain-containing protein [Janthinobacterium sp. Mn2066]|uniref:GGDEF domain-containing protein n=1 Tax=Janthinobacterium sp. Mn2066 TaxID=3395264 RepID=UPI003BDBFE1A